MKLRVMYGMREKLNFCQFVSMREWNKNKIYFHPLSILLGIVYYFRLFFVKQRKGGVRKERIAAIVLSYKRQRNIPLVVNGLKKQSFIDDIIIIHNHPSRLKIPGCKNIFSKENLGCLIRHQIAADLPDYDYFLFSDDDVMMVADMTDEILPSIRAHGRECVMGFFGQILDLEKPEEAYTNGEAKPKYYNEVLSKDIHEVLPIDLIKGRIHIVSKEGIAATKQSIYNTKHLTSEDDIRVNVAVQQEFKKASLLLPNNGKLMDLQKSNALENRSFHFQYRNKAVNEALALGWEPINSVIERKELEGIQKTLELKSLENVPDVGLLEEFKQSTHGLELRNIFNPSFFRNEKVKIFSYRAIPKGSAETLSYVSIQDESGTKVINVSEDWTGELNCKQLIDPKIFELHDGIYITFNSGFNPPKNDIFIMKVYPQMDRPKRITYKNRSGQERNWSFFSEDGEIYALYWINPLKILRVKKITADSWVLEDHFIQRTQDKSISDDLTIGTQLSKVNDKFYFIGHSKYMLRKKKIYLGRLCVFDFDKKSISLGRYWLVHSLESMRGNRIKHNTNLYSCSYFSGINAVGDSIIMGYGINDVDVGFAKAKINAL